MTLLCSQEQGWKTFSVTSQGVSVLGFVDRIVSTAVTQRYHPGVTAAQTRCKHISRAVFHKTL